MAARTSLASNAGRAAYLQVLVQDVRRVHEEVRPVELCPAEQLAEELRKLRLRVLPREVGVRLAEAGLRQHRHHRRPRERLREEDRLGVIRPHLPDRPLPERHRLRVRVVDAVGADAVPAPVQQDVAQSLPEPLPVLGVEVDVVDVLVALGRVLRVLERAVRPPVEPLRMLREPRVVRRALDREVERDLEPMLLGGRDEPIEVLQRPQLGVDRVVPSLRPADRPRAPRIALRGDECVVATLPVRLSRSDGSAAGR